MKITVFKYGEAMYKAANLFADLEGEEKISATHIAEAIQYRTVEL